MVGFMLQHEDVTHICDICNKKFTRDNQALPFQCSKCKQTFDICPDCAEKIQYCDWCEGRIEDLEWEKQMKNFTLNAANPWRNGTLIH